MKKLEFEKIHKEKKSTIISSEEALKDVIPIVWNDDIINGKEKVIIDK